MKSNNYQTAGTFTVVTTGNIDDLDFENCSIIRMENATLSTIRGLKAGYPGQEVTVMNVQPGQVNLEHENSGSLAQNRLLNTITVGPTCLAVTGTVFGSATYKYDDITNRWRLIHHNQGAWIDIPFDAANFTADGGGTWDLSAPDQVLFAFMIVGKSIIISYQFENTTIPTPVSTILSASFASTGYNATRVMSAKVALALNSGVPTPVFVQAVLTELKFQRDDFTTQWDSSADDTDVLGQIIFELD